MNILVLNSAILAVDPQDNGDTWQTPDQIIPKHVAEGAQLINVALPADYAPGKYTYDGGFVLVPTSKDDTDAKAQEVRNKRNQLLKDSDWTQMVDAPLTQSLTLDWQSYRQSLRDVTAQAGFPWDVTWPTEP